MFHNNYRVYKIGFEEYNIEIEYWNEITEKVECKNINVNESQMNILTDILNGLDFDDHTPSDNI